MLKYAVTIGFVGSCCTFLVIAIWAPREYKVVSQDKLTLIEEKSFLAKVTINNVEQFIYALEEGNGLSSIAAEKSIIEYKGGVGEIVKYRKTLREAWKYFGKLLYEGEYDKVKFILPKDSVAIKSLPLKISIAGRLGRPAIFLFNKRKKPGTD